MPETVKLISRGQRFITYEAENALAVDNALVAELEWPAGVSSLIINFREEIPDDYTVIEAKLSGKYMTRLIYRADKSDLRSRPDAGAFPEIVEYPFKNLAELQELYLFTEKKYFGEPWAGRLGYPWKQFLEGEYLKVIKINAEEYIPKAKKICFAKNGVPVALLPLNRTKDFDGNDTDWVTWVWVDPSLSRDERAEIRERFVRWMRDETAGRVSTGVNPFNAASNKFFRKMGFHCKCLQVTRAA